MAQDALAGEPRLLKRSLFFEVEANVPEHPSKG